MWNNPIFISETIGTFLIVFGAITTTAFVNKTDLKNKNLLTLAISTIILFIAVTFGCAKISGHAGRAWFNPISTLMGIAGDYQGVKNDIIGGLVGQVVGATTGVILGHLIIKPFNLKVNVVSYQKESIKNSVVGELLGVTIFMFGIAASMFWKVGNDIPVLSGLMVAISLPLAQLAFGLKFNLLLNPIVGLALLIQNAFETKVSFEQTKHYLIKAFVGFVPGALIGLSAYGLSFL